MLQRTCSVLKNSRFGYARHTDWTISWNVSITLHVPTCRRAEWCSASQAATEGFGVVCAHSTPRPAATPISGHPPRAGRSCHPSAARLPVCSRTQGWLARAQRRRSPQLRAVDGTRHTATLVRNREGRAQIREVASILGNSSVDTTMAYTDQDALDLVRSYERESCGRQQVYAKHWLPGKRAPLLHTHQVPTAPSFGIQGQARGPQMTDLAAPARRAGPSSVPTRRGRGALSFGVTPPPLWAIYFLRRTDPSAATARPGLGET